MEKSSDECGLCFVGGWEKKVEREMMDWVIK